MPAAEYVHIPDDHVEFVFDAGERHMRGNSGDTGPIEGFADGAEFGIAIAGKFDGPVPDLGDPFEGPQHIAGGLGTKGVELKGELHGREPGPRVLSLGS